MSLHALQQRLMEELKEHLAVIAAGHPAAEVGEVYEEVEQYSPISWNPEGEYEDDFAYHLFLHQLMKGAPPSEREAALRQLDTSLGGAASPRLEVCQALHDGALEGFESALEAVIDSHAAEQDDVRARSADIPTFEPRSRLFIEAFALLRIAANAGLQPAERDYRLCPVLGRVTPLRDRPDDIFAEMASLSPARQSARRGPPRP